MKTDLTINSKHVGPYEISSQVRSGPCVRSLRKIKQLLKKYPPQKSMVKTITQKVK